MSVSTEPASTGAVSMRELLEAAGDAELRWIEDEKLEAADVEPWVEMPLWTPERYAGTFGVDNARAAAAGVAVPLDSSSEPPPHAATARAATAAVIRTRIIDLVQV